MNADIITNTTYPHSTIEGFQDGCNTAHCPAEVSCRTVHTRYVGDWAFRRQINAGMTPAEIIATEVPEVPVRAPKVAPAPKTPTRKRKPPQRPRGSVHTDKVRELHTQGMLDKEIAAQLGIGRRTVTNIRDSLGLTPHHGVDADQVLRLHTDGLTDRQIADRHQPDPGEEDQPAHHLGCTQTPRTQPQPSPRNHGGFIVSGAGQWRS